MDGIFEAYNTVFIHYTTFFGGHKQRTIKITASETAKRVEMKSEC